MGQPALLRRALPRGEFADLSLSRVPVCDPLRCRCHGFAPGQYLLGRSGLWGICTTRAAPSSNETKGSARLRCHALNSSAKAFAEINFFDIARLADGAPTDVEPNQ